MHAETKLFQVVDALRERGGLAHFLYRGYQQCNQDGNDRNDDKELDQSKRTTS